MTKIETIIFEYEHCGECPYGSQQFGKHRCCKEQRVRMIPDLWGDGDIPDWCPLETKGVDND